MLFFYSVYLKTNDFLKKKLWHWILKFIMYLKMNYASNSDTEDRSTGKQSCAVTRFLHFTVVQSELLTECDKLRI